MTLQAGLELIFSIDSAQTAYGLVQTYAIDDNVQRATAVAPDGAVVSIQEFRRQSELSLTYLPIYNAGSTNDPAIGDPFIFAGSTWQVDNIVDKFTVEGFEAKEVNATYYPGVH